MSEALTKTWVVIDVRSDKPEERFIGFFSPKLKQVYLVRLSEEVDR